MASVQRGSGGRWYGGALVFPIGGFIKPVERPLQCDGMGAREGKRCDMSAVMMNGLRIRACAVCIEGAKRGSRQVHIYLGGE